MAGENKRELREVVRYYKKTGNKDKVQAAKYLIKYMPYHRSYELTAYSSYCQELRALWNSGCSIDTLISESNEISNKYRSIVKLEEDIKTISKEYLIWNIDYSFQMWENTPSLAHLNFEDFCEYVLPYKCIEYQPISKWKEYWANSYRGELDFVSQLDCFKTNARKAAEAVTYPYKHLIMGGPRNEEGLNIIEILDLETSFSRFYDACLDNAKLGIMTCRSKGIPVAIDYMPNWAYTSGRHYWNNVFSTRRRRENYEPFRIKPGDKHFTDNPICKVYRESYRPNSIILKALRKHTEIPPTLSLFSQDVTEEYTRTSTVKMTVPPEMRNAYVFLSVFDNHEWIPVDIAKTGVFGKALFSNVGRGVLYSLTSFQHGMISVIGEPFLLDLKGDIHTFHASHKKRSVILYRKFPSLSHIYNQSKYMRGGIIEAANNPSFSPCKEIVRFDESTIFPQKVAIDTIAYRYWRLKSSNKNRLDVAELFFYDGKSGKMIDCPKAGNLTDLNALTYETIEPGDAFIIDFSKPVSISAITCYKRGDGNDIFPGDEYELSWWDGDDWSVAGKKKAEDYYIDFPNVPEGALYYIRDVTRGTQNRTFIIEKDEIYWY